MHPLPLICWEMSNMYMYTQVYVNLLTGILFSYETDMLYLLDRKIWTLDILQIYFIYSCFQNFVASNFHWWGMLLKSKLEGKNLSWRKLNLCFIRSYISNAFREEGYQLVDSCVKGFMHFMEIGILEHSTLEFLGI